MPFGMSVVPYLLPQLENHSANFTYDNEGFLGFPTRKGFNKILFSKKQEPEFLQGRSVLEAAAFLQEWLFFGFLSDVLKVHVLKSQFLRDTVGQLSISLDALGSHITAWQNRINRLDDNERYIEVQRIDMIFQEFTELANYCLTDTGSACAICPLAKYPEISNNIILTAEILTYWKGPLFPKSQPFKLGFSALISTSMRELVDQGGWCPTDISMINAQFSANAAYFAIRLGPFQSRRDHSACTADECKWHNLPDYESHHLANCDCSDRSKKAHVNFPAEDIKPLLGDRRFPLITVHSIGKTCKVQMQSAKNPETSYKKYVAISHVFADGLGNEHENALPACQLKRLQRMVDALYDNQSDCPDSPLPFWFDTFCIPQGLSEKQVKKDAITDTATVYRNADRVLVLDADLLLFDAYPAIQHNNYNEVFMRIKLSRWMRRLWTLQEALLASDLWFQFKDGPLRFF
jgi:Heterokaryon incompatibility protein (HET)